VLARAATDLQTTLGRWTSAPTRASLPRFTTPQPRSADLRSASQDFRDLKGAANKNQAEPVHVLVSADTVRRASRTVAARVGLMVGDSALYRDDDTHDDPVAAALSDIQANPRKYFQFSVFLSNP